MDWLQVFTILGSTFAMFFWSRMESREDRNQSTQILIAIQQQINAIHQEMKDFHGRLCTIEERRK